MCAEKMVGERLLLVLNVMPNVVTFHRRMSPILFKKRGCECLQERMQLIRVRNAFLCDTLDILVRDDILGRDGCGRIKQRLYREGRPVNDLIQVLKLGVRCLGKVTKARTHALDVAHTVH